MKHSKFDPAYDQRSLVFRFRKHGDTKGFFLGQKRIAVGCSGGPDSVALFHLLRLAYPNLKTTLLHLNHGLRPKTASRDERFVKELAQKYQAFFLSARARQLDQRRQKEKASTEEVARWERYDFFKTALKKSKTTVLVLAHHLDDQAETVLMRVCQGTGPRGLVGIREILEADTYKIIRPLLPFSKKEILEFLKSQSFDFCHDETNAQTQFLRNRIRHDVFPFLKKKVNPSISEALARLAENAAQDQDCLEQIQNQAWKQLQVKTAKNGISFSRQKFEALHATLQFRILDHALKQLDSQAGLLHESAAKLRSLKTSFQGTLQLARGIDFEIDLSRISLKKRKS